MESFLLEGSSLVSYDGMWNIVSLLALSANPFLSGEWRLLVGARVTLVEKIASYLCVYPAAAKLLVKSLAWQDVVCQLFCVQKPADSQVIRDIVVFLGAKYNLAIISNNRFIILENKSLYIMRCVYYLIHAVYYLTHSSYNISF
jgi:hypothetical protein